MAFPVVPISRSALLVGQTNGRLDSSVLVDTPGQAGGPLVRLIRPAARAWRAMSAAALHDGHVLKATSLVDSYRPYSVQESIFLARYRTTYKANVDRKVWQGKTWYLWYGAVAAAPGTSNHGWAQAVDTGEEIDGDLGTERLDVVALAWLLSNADRFGWSWELQSEPWHLHYFAGDSIPAAVLAFEQGTPPVTPPSEEDDMPQPSIAMDPRVPYLPWLLGADGVTRVPITKTAAFNQLVAVYGQPSNWPADNPDLFDTYVDISNVNLDAEDLGAIKAAVKAALREGTG